MGRATLGPTCPVEPYPPDPSCAPRGFRAVVRVVRRADGRTVARVTTSSTGRFSIRLRPARYRVSARAANGASLPRCPAHRVTVHRDVFTPLRFDCDSGIR